MADNRYWMFRVKDKKIESKIFNSTIPPKGWLDSNRAAKLELKNGKPKAEKPQEKKSEELTLDLLSTSNDNSSGYHQSGS